MDKTSNINLSMLFDFYELTMGNGYFQNNMGNEISYFDVFYRSVPDKGGFAIAAGLEQVIDYIKDLHFNEEDIAYLRGRNLFSEGFLEYLANFKFTGDIWAVPEGTPIFPMEPFMTVKAPTIQAQLIETESKPYCPCRQRPCRDGIRLPSCTGNHGCCDRRTCRIHRRLHRNRLCGL